MFPITPIYRPAHRELEQLGTKRKYWFRDSQGRRMLFKAEERGTGDDWAEKIACELATLLGLPHVHYELAIEYEDQYSHQEASLGVPGVICESFVPDTGELFLGNQLLLRQNPQYPTGEGRKYKVREYTVDAVVEVLKGLKPPYSENLPDEYEMVTALDVFVGYVMFDTWIANQDRHHENWGAVRVGDQLYLAPSFDHAASLARNLTDQERDERLSTRDSNRTIFAFSQKARSAFYATENDHRPLTTMAAWKAFSLHAQQASLTWLNKLKQVPRNEVENVIARIPDVRISQVGRIFTLELLMVNQARIIAESDNEPSDFRGKPVA
jgi:hypothetical protein